MLPKTTVSFACVERKTGEVPSAGALVSAFCSSLHGSSGAPAALYRAAARHFLYWANQRGIALSVVDDVAVQRFEKHRCRCQGFSRHRPNRPVFTSRVRLFVRYLEDQGIVDIPEGVDHLDAHLVEYADFLLTEGYSTVSRQSYQSEAEHFAAWVRVSRLRWASLTREHVQQYAGHHCRCPVFRKRGTLAGHHGPARRNRGARRFIGFLRDRNILPAPTPVHHVDDLMAYKRWLERHCGASAATVQRYCGEVRRWLPVIGDPSKLDATAIRRIVSHRISATPGSASLVVGIMRSYIRFLITTDTCQEGLQHAFPKVRRHRLITLPRYMDSATIEKIIAGCQADTPVEIRDRAIILLLARLGLRAGDICQLRLTDIGWDDGHIRVSGKTCRSERLPLPQDVGDAILDYLNRARPRIDEERLFVRVQPPFRPFSSSAEIAGIVARVYERGAIDGVPTGSHTFRHSLATRMLRSGAGLDAVGTILRHSSAATTAIYAKVDIPMLLKVAQNWPGDVA